MREQGPNLTEAAPWIAKFHGKTLVVKIGGEVLTSDSAKNRIVAQLKTLHQCGMQVIVVHGAGKQVDEACQAAGIPIEKVNGRRITISLPDAASELLADRGYDPVYGARPLKRIIQRDLQDPLAMQILEGHVREGDHVTVDVGEVDGEEALIFSAAVGEVVE